MTPRNWRIAYIASVCICALLLLIGIATRALALVFVALALFCAASLSGLVFWRCERCRKVLPLLGVIQMGRCPHCGDAL